MGQAARKIEPEIEEEVTPRSVARECMEQADGDWHAAAELMQKRIDGDPALRAAVLEPMLSAAVWSLIRAAGRELRRPGPQAEGSDVSAEELRETIRRSIYEWPLVGGMKLGDATRDEVEGSVEFYGMLEARNAARKAWLSAVVAKMARAGDKRVREVLTEKQLESMRAKAGA